LNGRWPRSRIGPRNPRIGCSYSRLRGPPGAGGDRARPKRAVRAASWYGKAHRHGGKRIKRTKYRYPSRREGHPSDREGPLGGTHEKRSMAAVRHEVGCPKPLSGPRNPCGGPTRQPIRGNESWSLGCICYRRRRYSSGRFAIWLTSINWIPSYRSVRGKG